MEHLRAAGVPVTVINGITAWPGGPHIPGRTAHPPRACARRGVCHRPCQPGDTGTDWKALARTARDAKLTLVIYMGVSGAATIEQELLSGLPAHTPVAIIQHASLRHQRHAITTLGQLQATITAQGWAAPQ